MAKTKIMTMAEAAHRILLKAGKKMHYRDIMAKALKGKMVKTSGKTPEQSLRSLMATEFVKKASKSRFRPKGDGYYELTAYGKKTPPADAARSSNRKAHTTKKAKPTRKKSKKKR